MACRLTEAAVHITLVPAGALISAGRSGSWGAELDRGTPSAIGSTHSIDRTIILTGLAGSGGDTCRAKDCGLTLTVDRIAGLSWGTVIEADLSSWCRDSKGTGPFIQTLGAVGITLLGRRVAVIGTGLTCCERIGIRAAVDRDFTGTGRGVADLRSCAVIKAGLSVSRQCPQTAVMDRDTVTARVTDFSPWVAVIGAALSLCKGAGIGTKFGWRNEAVARPACGIADLSYRMIAVIETDLSGSSRATEGAGLLIETLTAVSRTLLGGRIAVIQTAHSFPAATRSNLTGAGRGVAGLAWITSLSGITDLSRSRCP